MTEELMQIGEAARRLGVDPSTIRRMTKGGYINPRRNRWGRYFFTEADVEEIRKIREPKQQEVEP